MARGELKHSCLIKKFKPKLATTFPETFSMYKYRYWVGTILFCYFYFFHFGFKTMQSTDGSLPGRAFSGGYLTARFSGVAMDRKSRGNNKRMKIPGKALSAG